MVSSYFGRDDSQDAATCLLVHQQARESAFALLNQGVSMTHTIHATNRRSVLGLIEVRRALEGEHDTVLVVFASGEPSVTYSRADLYAIRERIIFSM